MKKFIGVLLTVLIFTANASVFASQTVEYTHKITAELTSFYECEFQAKLDSTYKGTWVYDLSENGALKLKFQRLNPGYGTPSDILLTFYKDGKETKYFDNPIGQSFGSRGTYDFCYYMHQLVGNEVRDYSTVGVDTVLYLRLSLTKNDGVNSIKLWLHDGNSTDGKGILPITSVIEADNNTFKESGIGAQYIFNINGDYKENISGSKDDNRQEEDTDEKQADDDETPVDYSDLSQDPRRWDDKEKSIAAYGKYRDENGVFHAVNVLRGSFRGSSYDYNVNITAKFDINLSASDRLKDISSDHHATVTYYNIVCYIDGKEKEDRQVVKLSGDKGTKWFLSGDVEVRKADERVEVDAGSKLKDDCSIYMGFIPLEKFENNQCEYESGVNEMMSFVFQYNDNTKTVMKSILVDLEGAQAMVDIDKIDYSGGLIQYFLNVVYPNISTDLSKKLGLSV